MKESLDFGLVERVMSLTPWTTPGPLGASWAANWAISPALMCILCMCSAAVMYYPFLKAYERSLLKQEEEREEAEKAFTGDVAMATRQNIR